MEAWRECGLVQKDFGIVVRSVSQLLGPDLFSYRFDDGQEAYDCSLGEKFVGPMSPLVIKKIITVRDAMPASSERGFSSLKMPPPSAAAPCRPSAGSPRQAWAASE